MVPLCTLTTRGCRIVTCHPHPTVLRLRSPWQDSSARACTRCVHRRGIQPGHHSSSTAKTKRLTDLTDGARLGQGCLTCGGGKAGWTGAGVHGPTAEHPCRGCRDGPGAGFAAGVGGQGDGCERRPEPRRLLVQGFFSFQVGPGAQRGSLTGQPARRSQTARDAFVHARSASGSSATPHVCVGAACAMVDSPDTAHDDATRHGVLLTVFT